MSNQIIAFDSFMPRKLVLTPLLLVGLLSAPVLAGDEWKEEHIMREISYLAQKLLDMSGKDTVKVESPAYVKPFLGVCSEILQEGVKLTCVTPKTQAAKAGLQTGDVVVSMNGLNMVNKDERETKRIYYGIVENMKTGEEMKISLLRDGKRIDVVATVGSLSHPAYVLEVKR